MAAPASTRRARRCWTRRGGAVVKRKASVTRKRKAATRKALQRGG